MTKWIMGLAVLIAAIVASGAAQAQLNVPDTFKEHMPIVIDAGSDADVYIWSVSKPARRVIVDNGKQIHVWAPPGNYEISLTTISIDWDAKSVDYDEFRDEFSVGDTPNPNPNPNPDPDPDPSPVPTTNFKKQISDALQGVSNRDATVSVVMPDGNTVQMATRAIVADVYATVADEAEAQPTSWDAAIMVNEAKVRVASSLPGSALSGWTPFWPKLGAAFKELKLSASDLQGHIKAFRDVADVLEQ